MYSGAALKRQRENRDDIFSPQTVIHFWALNNGAVESGHAHTLKGFCCIALIRCHRDEGVLCHRASQCSLSPWAQAHIFSITMFWSCTSLWQISSDIHIDLKIRSWKQPAEGLCFTQGDQLEMTKEIWNCKSLKNIVQEDIWKPYESVSCRGGVAGNHTQIRPHEKSLPLYRLKKSIRSCIHGVFGSSHSASKLNIERS